jgi:hypothetical protein
MHGVGVSRFSRHAEARRHSRQDGPRLAPQIMASIFNARHLRLGGSAPWR